MRQRTIQGPAPSSYFLFSPSQRRSDEVAEERVGDEGTGFEFRVELHANEPWVVFQLHNLNKIVFLVDARDDQSGFLDTITIIVIELVPMAMAFGDGEGLRGRRGRR